MMIGNKDQKIALQPHKNSFKAMTITYLLVDWFLERHAGWVAVQLQQNSLTDLAQYKTKKMIHEYFIFQDFNLEL